MTLKIRVHSDFIVICSFFSVQCSNDFCRHINNDFLLSRIGEACKSSSTDAFVHNFRRFESILVNSNQELLEKVLDYVRAVKDEKFSGIPENCFRDGVNLLLSGGTGNIKILYPPTNTQSIEDVYQQVTHVRNCFKLIISVLIFLFLQWLSVENIQSPLTFASLLEGRPISTFSQREIAKKVKIFKAMGGNPQNLTIREKNCAVAHCSVFSDV